MSPEIGLAATRIALFLIVSAGLMLLLVSRESAEFVVLILTIGIGLVMLGAVAFLSRMGAPHWAKPPKVEDNESPVQEEAMR